MPNQAVRPKSGFGLYIHFPWCLSKCGYCDFYSLAIPDRATIDHEGYASAVISELEHRWRRSSFPRVTTIYVGGGTPSLWRPRAVKRVLDAAFSVFDAERSAVEVTVECNPSSFDREIAQGLRAAGANRLSLGVQSLDNQQLAFLGRRHDSKQALEALSIALNCGIEQISADLLFGLPGQTLADELAQIVEIAALPLSHVSAYALTIEEGTPFGRLAQQGRLPLAVDERVADAFLAVDAELTRRGYEHYEISNFAKPGKRSLHNQQYWWGRPYLGLGAGAVGTIEVEGRWQRYRNPRNVKEYLRGQSLTDCSGVDVPDDLEYLDADTRLRERLMLGLRLREGVDLDMLRDELDTEPLTPERKRAIQRLVEQKRLSMVGSRCYIEPGAWLLADGTIAQLM